MRGKMIVVLGGVILVLLFLGTQRTLADDDGSVIVVSQDGNGDFDGKDEKPILAAIKKVGKQGGTIQIGPGEYLIRRGLRLPSGTTIRGTKQTVLKLASPVIVTEAAKHGQDFIVVGDTSELAADTRIEIYPPAGMKTFPGSDERTCTVEIREIEQGKLILSRHVPPHGIPEKSRVGYTSNMFFVLGSKKNILLENLVLDGGRKKDISMPGHCQRCALLAHGIWSYKEGPTAPPIENVQVVDCHIRNCYGRAVAMYSVVRGKVAGCLIEDIDDDGIDLDHFCYHCEVTGNTVRRSHTGVTINDGSYCTIKDNRFENCTVGVSMWWWHHCPQENLNVENLIQNNVISSPTRAGISLGKKCVRNKIIGNVVEGKINVAESDNLLEGNTSQ